MLLIQNFWFPVVICALAVAAIFARVGGPLANRFGIASVVLNCYYVALNFTSFGQWLSDAADRLPYPYDDQVSVYVLLLLPAAVAFALGVIAARNASRWWLLTLLFPFYVGATFILFFRP
jgi:hypothetical protein